MLQDGLLALSASFTANTTPATSEEIAEREGPQSQLTHTTIKPSYLHRRQWNYTVFTLAEMGLEPGPRPHRISQIPVQGNFRQSRFAIPLLPALRGCARIYEPESRPVLV